ncbi:MAG: hypothetical protein K2N74_00230, partial [Clostridiales bacterium]|nr:hypothetical protein [Clostridiales bacterium]
MENLNMSGILCDNAGEYTGSLIGDNLGASVLNCHATGKITAKLTYFVDGGSNLVSVGGLVGMVRGEAYVYRCSVNMNLDFTINNHTGGGGIVGCLNLGGNLHMYDCLSITTVKLTVTSYDIYYGGLVGLHHTRVQHSRADIDGCVSYMESTYSGTAASTHDSPTTSGYGWNTNKPTNFLTYSMSNTYASGWRKYNANGQVNTWGAEFYGTLSANTTFSGSNFNWYATTVTNYGNYSNVPSELYTLKGLSSTKYDGSAGRTQADLYDAAKVSAQLSSKVWVNKKVIDEDYMTGFAGTTACKYTIENSPVRNPLVVRVSYYNHKTSGDEAINFSGVTQPVIKKAGDSLENPGDTATRKFIGWTTDANWTADKMGTDEAPFTSMPANLIGDNKLYAVWQAKTSSAEITAKMGNSGTALTYDATNGFVGKYDGTGIVLTANLTTVSDMTNPQITYQWTRGGENIGTDGTGKDYTIKYVDDTRNYSDDTHTQYENYEFGVRLNFTSQSEPLFFGSTIATQRKVAMNPVEPSELEFINVRIKTGQRAYIGANTSSVDLLGEVYLKTDKSNALAGTLAWDNLNARFGADDGNISGNKETRTVYFIPSKDYKGNYGNSIPYDFTFTIDTLKFTFKLTGFTDPTMQQIQVDLVYGDNYGYNKIADLFETAMIPHMSKLGGNAPIFKLLDNSEYRIAAFRTENKTFENVSDPAVLQITVRFEPQSHSVTFNENGGTLEEGAELKSQTVRYGNHASVPNVKMTNGSLLFLGWFYNTTDDKGNPVEKQWDFDNDCVTQDLAFHAVWLAANTLEGLTVEAVPGAVFPANTPIDKSKLIVTATYSGTRDGKSVEQKVILDASQYTLEYYNSDGDKFWGDALHVTTDGSDTKVVVKFVNPGSILVTDDRDKTEIFIKPQKSLLNTQELIDSGYYGDITVEKDQNGNALSHPIDTDRVADLFPEINTSKITYTYSRGGIKVDPDEVKEPGEYTVTVHFETLNADFEAPDISVMLRIVREKTTLNVKWDATKFTFNNKVQVPTPTFTATNADGTEREVTKVKYHLTGDTDAKTVSADYYVN